MQRFDSTVYTTNHLRAKKASVERVLRCALPIEGVATAAAGLGAMAMCQTRRTALRGMISCGVCSDVNIQEVSLFFTPLRGKLHRSASVHRQKSNTGWKLMRELWWPPKHCCASTFWLNGGL